MARYPLGEAGVTLQLAGYVLKLGADQVSKPIQFRVHRGNLRVHKGYCGALVAPVFSVFGFCQGLISPGRRTRVGRMGTRHGTVAAYLALFISLGGTGYAATQLAPNSVGTKQVRNGSIQARDLNRNVLSKRNARLAEAVTQVVTDPATGLNINVSAKDGDPGPIGPQGPEGAKGADSTTAGPQGTQGVQGEKGAQGDPGGSWGYGRVAEDGTLSQNSGLIVTHPATGIYCVDAVLTAHVAVATVEGDGATTRAAAVTMFPGSSTACNGKDALVATALNGSAGDVPFYLIVN